MNLGAEYSRAIGATIISLQGYAVGPAPYGPPVFMHRPSAAENPQAPLSHHYLDAAHITPGVVALGIERAGFMFEAGAFHGQEPDENRLDLDTGRARLVWRAPVVGRWSMVDADVRRRSRRRQNNVTLRRHAPDRVGVVFQGRRAIGRWRGWRRSARTGKCSAISRRTCWKARAVSANHVLYARAESVEKDILDAGFHPIGAAHTHRTSLVSAFTIGYIRDVASRTWGTFGIGGDITGYIVPDNLSDSYGSPASFHVFVRYEAAPASIYTNHTSYSAIYSHRSFGELRFQIVKNGWPAGVFPSGPGLFGTM